MVLDTGGVDDRSFNQSSYAGFTEAQKENANITPTYIASNSDADYVPNLTPRWARAATPSSPSAA